MKLELIKRGLAAGLCVAMLFGDVLPAAASVSGGDAAETVTAAQQEANTVSDGIMTDTVSDGDLADTVLAVTVDGVTITVTAPAGTVPENAQLWAEEISGTDQLAVIDEALAAEARREETRVQKYKAFDLKILSDGEAVQPREGVTVTFSGDIALPQKKEESVAVYHVTEDAAVNDMEARVTAGDTVELVTNHFSTFVIVVKQSDFEKKITFHHYLGTPEEHSTIYAPSAVTVGPNQYLQAVDLPLQGGENYTVSRVLVTSGEEITDYTNDVKNESETVIELNGPENVIDIYYTENELTYSNKTTFFDYYVDGQTEGVYNVTPDSWTKIKKEFTLNNDKTVYSGDTMFYRNLYSRDWSLGLIRSGESGETKYLLKEGDRLHFRDANDWVWKYNEDSSDGAFWQEGTRYTAFDAGINAGADHSKPFLAMGLARDKTGTGDTYNVNSNIDFTILKNGNKLNLNMNNARVGGGDWAIVPGLVAGLNDPDGNHSYPELVMGTADNGQQIQEPGYFTGETSDDKAVYENYSLHFKQSGNTYVLDYVQNDAKPENKTWSYLQNGTHNSKFFPLNDVEPIGGRTSFEPSAWEDSNGGKTNFYFGMRYDFTFSIGDYVGPMNYEFSGDDDLWVFVDGKPALDLGGMHSAYPNAYGKGPEANSVELWKFLFGFEKEEQKLTLTEEQKKETHTVSILYMERGGYDSTCAMKFVIPNVEAKPPVISNIPRADVELVKKDSRTGETIANVGFTLYADEKCEEPLVNERFTDGNGKISFHDLYEGVYYLKETSYDAEAYKANETVCQIIVTRTGKETAAAVVEGLTQDDGAYVIYNTPVRKLDLVFQKIDSYTHEALLGVRFFLYRNDAKGELIGSAYTDKDGLLKFEGIEEGTYYLEEAVAPSGYIRPGKGWTIAVRDQNGTLIYEVTDFPEGLWTMDGSGQLIKNQPFVSFQFTKTDASNGQKMSGVEFKLFKGLKNDQNEWTATTESTDNGIVRFDKLSVGQEYLLVETTPEGYVRTNPWVIRVDYDENSKQFVQKIFDTVFDPESNEWKYDGQKPYEDAVIQNVPAKGSLILEKTIDRLNMAYGAASFTFKIEKSGGETLYRTITFEEGDALHKSVTVENLPVGDYTVTELANLRYRLKEFSVTVNGEVMPNQNLAEVTQESIPVYRFANEQRSDQYFSHSDLTVNRFRQNESGGIEISREIQVKETERQAISGSR